MCRDMSVDMSEISGFKTLRSDLNTGHGQDAHLLWHVCRWNPPGKTQSPRKNWTSNQVSICTWMLRVVPGLEMAPSSESKSKDTRHIQNEKQLSYPSALAHFHLNSCLAQFMVHRGSNSLFTWQIKQIESHSKIPGVNKGMSSNAAAATKETLHGNVGKKRCL